jgi:hypothetical protein
MSSTSPIVGIPPLNPPVPILPNSIDELNLGNSKSMLLNSIYKAFQSIGKFFLMP